MVKFKEIEDHAIKMADAFVQHSQTVKVSDGEGEGSLSNAYVSDTGLYQLGEIFDTVPFELRAGVYSVFLDKLSEQGIMFDIDQFKGTVH